MYVYLAVLARTGKMVNVFPDATVANIAKKMYAMT